MRVWRLCRTVHADKAFTGEGARKYGGRWNPKGFAVVYTSATLSLAVLETLVHVEADTLPDDYLAFPADIPDGVEITEVSGKRLRDGWREPLDHEALQAIGAAWIQAGENAVLSVPSAVVPDERNYLLNPTHPRFKKIKPRPGRTFTFDRRLIGLQLRH